MDDQNQIDGNHAINVLGSISIVSAGAGITLEANGEGLDDEGGSLVMKAAKTAGVFCEPAAISLVSVDESQGLVTILGGTEGSIKQMVGPLETGAVMQLAPEEIKITVGPEGAGASITMTPESITFRVAEVTLTLTPEGITEDVAEVTREVTPEGHNMTAAEVEFNIGVEGVAWEGPTESQEVEAGTLENETLGSHTTDAAKNEDAGIALEI